MNFELLFCFVLFCSVKIVRITRLHFYFYQAILTRFVRVVYSASFYFVHFIFQCHSSYSPSFILFFSACYSTFHASDVFVLLACDGVYDVMENQEIVDILSYKLGYTGLISYEKKQLS